MASLHLSRLWSRSYGLKSIEEIQITSTKYPQVLILGPLLGRHAHTLSHTHTHTRAHTRLLLKWKSNTLSHESLQHLQLTMAAKRRPLCCVCVAAIRTHELHANLTETKLKWKRNKMQVQLLLRGPGSQTPGGDVMGEMQMLALDRTRGEVEGTQTEVSVTFWWLLAVGVCIFCYSDTETDDRREAASLRKKKSMGLNTKISVHQKCNGFEIRSRHNGGQQGNNLANHGWSISESLWIPLTCPSGKESTESLWKGEAETKQKCANLKAIK